MSDTIFNLQQAAKYLKVNPRTLTRMIQRAPNPIPFQRTSPRGSYRFHKAALDGWLTRSDSNPNNSLTNSLHDGNAFCQGKNEDEALAQIDATRGGVAQGANSANGGAEGAANGA